jgi:hypothetical protein
MIFFPLWGAWVVKVWHWRYRLARASSRSFSMVRWVEPGLERQDMNTGSAHAKSVAKKY